MILIQYTKFYPNSKIKKRNKILFEKYKDMLAKPLIEQSIFSGTTNGIFKVRHNSIRLMKWLAYYDRSFYEKIIYYDLMGPVLKILNEIS